MNAETLKKIAQDTLKMYQGNLVKSQNHGQVTTNVLQVQRPEGLRYYKGMGIGPSTMMRKSQATFNALLKARQNPADSMTTKQVEMFRGDKK